MSSEIKAVIFDLYNTLIYTSKPARSYQKLIEVMQLSKDESKAAFRFAMCQETSLETFVANYRPSINIDLDPYKSAIREELSATVFYPEAENVLAALQKKRIVLGIISNVASPFKKAYCNLNIQRFIPRDNVIFSCEVGLKKRDPEIYIKGLEAIAVFCQNTLMVGDSLKNDVLAPMELGLRSVLLDRDNKYTYPDRIRSLDGIFRYLHNLL